ncbi:MAG: cellulose biosynthesis protein BcsS [Xanthobacteraceae bacterium]|nr:cellulose biosynthesis protein BcsS [Xanthobacteraceae bacterium]
MVATLLACWSGPTLAQTQVSSDPDELSGGAAPERFLFFSGFDLWNFGYAGYAGAQWAPASLNSDGFVLGAFVSEGVERFDTPATRYRTAILRASILPGWRFKRGSLEVKVFAGPDFERDTVAPAQVGRLPYRNSFGARATVDLWWEPTAATMLSASASATTIGSGTSARVAGGWRLSDAGWIGPEIAVSADRFSEQYRVGAHLTGVRTGDFEWSLAAGYVRDSFRRSGIYGRITVLTRR